MRYATLNKVWLKIGLVLLCAGLVMAAAAGWAQENSIRLPDFYPESLSGTGCIDTIDHDRAVIDDRLMIFYQGATFHTPNKKRAGWMDFDPGNMVGFIINEENEIESLWYMKPCQ
jgi:hypothetical protein